MALRQNLIQKLEQRLSPQQIQLMKLLQVPTMELDQRIKQEIEENPALEEGKEELEEDYSNEEEFEERESDDFDISDYLQDDVAEYKTRANNQSKDSDDKVIPFSGGTTFRERLNEQLQLLKLEEGQELIAHILIGNLDEAGYLNRDLEAIVDDLAFSMNVHVNEQEVLAVLHMIQGLDPAGVGARNLQECLLLQINRKQDGNISKYTAKTILENHFEEFTKKHYEKIAKKLEIVNEDLKEAIDEILNTNPKPGGASKGSNKNFQQIVPDFIIYENEGRLELTINSRNAPELRVSREYETMLRSYSEGAKTSKTDKEAVNFVKQKLDNAKWFIDAIRQRHRTLMLTMSSIMNFQKDYFLSGDEKMLKPMILKDIAEIINMDISTISRVANSKYIESPYGIKLLKSYFSEGMKNKEGEEISTIEIKKILKEIVDQEDKNKPLSDIELSNKLSDKGYKVARRTVSKYREQLDISVARLRKEL